MQERAILVAGVVLTNPKLQVTPMEILERQSSIAEQSN
jgi:hypothetical protein